MKGIKAVFPLGFSMSNYEKTFFDTTTFNEVVAIVGNSTWEVMQTKSLESCWQPIESYTQNRNMLGRRIVEKIPAGLEDTNEHKAKLAERITQPATVRRKDGDVETAFKKCCKNHRTYF
jgi:isoquinoline 1-oxidoreductase beta subunit